MEAEAVDFGLLREQAGAADLEDLVLESLDLLLDVFGLPLQLLELRGRGVDISIERRNACNIASVGLALRPVACRLEAYW